MGLSQGPTGARAGPHGRNVRAEEPGCLVQLLVQPHTSCVVLGMFFNFSEAQFHLGEMKKNYFMVKMKQDSSRHMVGFQ